MKEYDIFVPLYYNDGTPIESAKFQHLQALLLERFEGLTFFPQPNQGFWFGNMTYRDEISPGPLSRRTSIAAAIRVPSVPPLFGIMGASALEINRR